MTDSEAIEMDMLDAHEQQWLAQGYELVRQPTRAQLPDFLQKYVPDAVLIGRDPKVVVEVVRKGQHGSSDRLRDLSALLAGRAEWRLQVIYAGETIDTLPSVPSARVSETLNRVRHLARTDVQASLLLLWATLEAISRRLDPSKTARPQSAVRIVELLASTGRVLPSQAAKLREAAAWRNRLVHGDLDIILNTSDIEPVIDIVQGLAEPLMRGQPGNG